MSVKIPLQEVESLLQIGWTSKLCVRLRKSRKIVLVYHKTELLLRFLWRSALLRSFDVWVYESLPTNNDHRSLCIGIILLRSDSSATANLEEFCAKSIQVSHIRFDYDYWCICVQNILSRNPWDNRSLLIGSLGNQILFSFNCVKLISPSQKIIISRLLVTHKGGRMSFTGIWSRYFPAFGVEKMKLKNKAKWLL